MQAIHLPASQAAATRFLRQAHDRELSITELLEELSLTLIDDQEVLADGAQNEPESNSRAAPGSVASSPWVQHFIEKVKTLPAGVEFSLGSILKDHWDELPEPRVLGRVVAIQLAQQKLAVRDGNWEEPGMAKMAKYIRI